jgi:Domain of unknown function (DUF4389)
MEPHPVRFWVDYPDRPLNRLTSAFRFVTIIPIAILLGLLDHANASYRTSGGGDTWVMAGTAGGAVIAPLVLMLLFREKYPRWWYDWNLELARFGNRVTAYWLLMDDRYPSTDDHQAVHLEYPEVTGPELNRWLPLVKWFLAIPHYFVLLFLWIAVFFVGIYVWFAVLFTGHYPRGAFDFIEGVLRWGNRVAGYAFAMVTDTYPPFRLAA